MLSLLVYILALNCISLVRQISDQNIFRVTLNDLTIKSIILFVGVTQNWDWCPFQSFCSTLWFRSSDYRKNNRNTVNNTPNRFLEKTKEFWNLITTSYLLCRHHLKVFDSFLNWCCSATSVDQLLEKLSKFVWVSSSNFPMSLVHFNPPVVSSLRITFTIM